MYTPTSLGHTHFFPFQDLPISISHFSKFRFTAKITSFSIFTVCKTFSFNLWSYSWLILEIHFKPQISLHLPFSGENEKLLALDGGLNEPTVGQPTCYICKTD